jgi:LmbE family N-acetylglucosaminyl deacetylase
MARAGIIVAHPDDETLWAGGTVLMHGGWHWTVITVCRGSDAERAGRFYRAMALYGAKGAMADLDDGPEQKPLPEEEIRKGILSTLPDTEFDVIFTHGPRGEYTRHLRHEETSAAVLALWEAGKLLAEELRMFAYEDGGGLYLPRAVKHADRRTRLPSHIWQRKYEIVTKVYGFSPDSLEGKTTPSVEAFWSFATPEDARRWTLQEGGRR